MEDNKVLKLVYTFFLGLLLAVFVGVGINTFYPAPEEPKYPTELNVYREKPTPEQEQEQREFDRKLKQHDENMKPYNRNISIMTLIAAFIFLALSIIYEKRIKIIADGVMLGGLFTLFYSIGMAFASDNSKYVFLVVSAGLAVVLYLGYRKFVHPSGGKISKK